MLLVFESAPSFVKFIIFVLMNKRCIFADLFSRR